MEDNKYSVILNASPDSEERKKARRKKKTRARLCALLIFILVLALLVVGGLYIGKILVSRYGSQESSISTEEGSVSDNNPEDVRQAIEEIIGSEEDVTFNDEPEPEAPTEEELYDAWIGEKVADLTLEEKVMGLFIVTPESITGVDTVVQAGEGTKAALEQYPVGGILYSGKNILSADQFKTMIANTKDYVRYETFYVLKEEPGNGVLAKALSLETTETEAAIGETMDPYTSYSENTKIALYLKEFGINFNIGMVGDVVFSEDEEEEISSVMADRSFGTDPTIVARMVAEGIGAYQENDLAVCLGYFPGQGNLSEDPEAGLVNTDLTDEDITGYQAPVYQAALEAGVDAVIVSNVYAANITSGNLPCSLSKEIYTDYLREQLGFTDTILITDELDDPSISDYYTSAEACVKALKAGADMVLCPENFEEGYQGVLDAVNTGVISEERINDSLKRIWKVKYKAQYEAEKAGSVSANDVSAQ